MYRSFLSVLGLCALLSAGAQQTVHQVFVLNEGYFDFNTQTQVVPVSLGSYDPVAGTYQTVASIPGPRFASDVEVAEGVVYVAADDQLLKYDADSHVLLGQVTVPGIRQLALWNDRVLLTRGELGGLPHYFEVRLASDLSLDYAITPADGLLYSAEDVKVVGDVAHLAVGNAFDWGNLVGEVAQVDLTTGSYLGAIDLGPDGLNPEHIMVDGTELFVLNNTDFSKSSISRVSGGALSYTVDVAVNSSCGASVLADGQVYYMEYALNKLARFGTATGSITDTLAGSLAPYGMLHDPVNGVLYTTTTDFVTSGELHVTALDGTILSMVAVGVSPGRLALDLRSGNGVEDHEALDLRLFPNPAEDRLQVSRAGSAEGGQLVVRDAAGREVLRQAVPSGSVSFAVDVQALPGGTYLLQLNNGAAHRFTKR